MADFGLLGPMPNFAQSVIGGYQAGQAMARQRATDAALAGVDLDRPETLLPVLRADPTTGAALIGASVRLASEKRQNEGRLAQAAYIKAMTAGQGGGTTSSSGPATSAPATATMGGDGDLTVTSPIPTPVDPQAGQPGDIVVQGQRTDPNAVRNAAIDADPTGFLDIQSKLGAMDEVQRKRVADASGAFASIGNALLQVPYAQRRGFLQAHAADLAAHGVPPEKIASFDPTDDNIHFEVGQALGIKGQLDQADKDRAFGLDQQRFGETQRHNRVDEGQGQQRIGIEGAHLQLSRNADARAAASAGRAAANASGANASSAGIPAPTTRAEFNALPKGTRFRAPDGSVRVK